MKTQFVVKVKEKMLLVEKYKSSRNLFRFCRMKMFEVKVNCECEEIVKTQELMKGTNTLGVVKSL